MPANNLPSLRPSDSLLHGMTERQLKEFVYMLNDSIRCMEHAKSDFTWAMKQVEGTNFTASVIDLNVQTERQISLRNLMNERLKEIAVARAKE